MQKITKNEYIELSKNGFYKLGYTSNFNKLKESIINKNLKSIDLIKNDFFNCEIRATQLIHKNIYDIHDNCYENLTGKNEYYKYQLNDILYLLHIYFEDNEPYNIAIKGIVIK
jgi:nitrous oxidase accessory protein NosD